MAQLLTDKITLQQACDLLRVSRPTFNKYRKKYKFRELKLGRQCFFSRLELIKRVLIPVGGSSNLILDECNIDAIEFDTNVFDLRWLTRVDEFGAMSLLCLLKRRLRNAEQTIIVIVNNSAPCLYLKAIGFFDELKRHAPNLFINDDDLRDGTPLPPENILPLINLGYKGAEKRVLERLYVSLESQGFSENLCSRLGWTLGELADNAHTHAGGPCFMTIVSRPSKINEPKFLCISIGDLGGGIAESLKQNPKYQTLSDLEALYSSFKSSVSTWDDSANRGKGLNDLLAIGMGNRAWVRVESNGHSIFFDFGRQPCIVNKGRASTRTVGTRFSLVLIDSNFSDITKETINSLIDEEMRSLE